MFTTVNVPLDGSQVAERALGPALALARATGSEIRLIRVVDHRGATKARADLDSLSRTLDHPRPTVEVIESDWPAEAIVGSGAGPDSLLCMSTHGSSGIRRILLGSVAEDILRMSSTPVVLIGPNIDDDAAAFDPTGGTMIICSDGSTAAAAIVPTAREWCEALQLEPWLTAVIDSRAGSGEADVTAAETNHVRTLAREFRGPGRDAEWEVLHGSVPARAIVDFAGGLPASFIAMATHGRTGLARVTLGSVATEVVRESRCPVLVLRPPELFDDRVTRP